jgi:hypothetical protein
MESVYLDTALLAVPNYAVDSETAKELIDRVTYFAQLALPEIPLRLVIAEQVETLLWEGNVGPDYEQIDQFIQIMNLASVFSAHDLLRQYQTIMDRAGRAGDNIPIDVQVICGFRTEPLLPENLFPAILRPETERIFASVAALQKFEDAWNVGSAIHSVGGLSYFTNVEVDRAVGPRVNELGSPPFQISMPVRVVRHLRDLVASGSAARLWANAETAEELHFAITIGGLSVQRALGKGGEAADLRRFLVGPEFKESLRACQCYRQDRFASVTLALCSQIVADACTKPIGIFGRPAQAVRIFDSAGGFRVHLTKGALGLRLMFWESDRVIEFANVGVKNELQIQRGYQGGGVSSDIGQFL